MVVGPVSHPDRASASIASTATYMEGLIVGWINNARAARGIPRLTVGSKLTDLAGDRAAYMASGGPFAHPSCLSCLLRKYAISFSRCAEVIAWNSYAWGYTAARTVFLQWRNSSAHWGILMSRSYTRIGIGVAYRSRDRSTFAAGVLAG
jgi:uncharacterized protein YkwD